MTYWKLSQLGNCVDIFLNGCNKALANNLDMRLDILRQKGNKCGFPVTKPLGNGLFELRARAGTEQARLIYFYAPNQQIIFVHAFTKSGSGKDEKELRKAIRIKKNIKIGAERANEITYVH